MDEINIGRGKLPIFRYIKGQGLWFSHILISSFVVESRDSVDGQSRQKDHNVE